MAHTEKHQALSDIEKTFTNIYPLTFNIQVTAEKMGVSNQTCHNWLKKEAVKKELRKKQQVVAQKCDVTLDEVLNELRRIAFFDHKSYLEKFSVCPESGDIGATLKDLEEMDTRAIQELNCKINSQGIPYVTVKPYNKIEALKELANRLTGIGGDRHLHLHLTPEEMKEMTTDEAASLYQQMVQRTLKR